MARSATKQSTNLAVITVKLPEGDLSIPLRCKAEIAIWDREAEDFKAYCSQCEIEALFGSGQSC